MTEKKYSPELPGLEAWRAAAQKSLKQRPLDELTWHTPEGIDVKPLYTAEDIKDLEVRMTNRLYTALFAQAALIVALIKFI